jgi:spore coat polysaccharide biosynthesis protein SpsF
MTSTRLPGKVLAFAEGKPMLELMIERLRFVPEIDEIVIATTVNEADDPVVELAERAGVNIYRGSEHDVLGRVLNAAMEHRADVIVELTGDCPLIDPALVSMVTRRYLEAGVQYVSNVLQRSYPDGMDTQVFSTSVLADVDRRSVDPSDREHVSLYIYSHPELYSLANVTAPSAETRPDMRLTLDTANDLALIRAVFTALRPTRRDFSLAEIISFLDENPAIAELNAAPMEQHA